MLLCYYGGYNPDVILVRWVNNWHASWGLNAISLVTSAAAMECYSKEQTLQPQY